MTQKAQQHPMTQKVVLYQPPGIEAVTVQRDIEYRATESGALTMDLYYPAERSRRARLPALVFVAGYPDPRFERILGCRFKEMGSSISWGRLAAASGLVAITYTNREPAADVQVLLGYVRRHAAELEIDAERIGLWASSGNVPLALSTLMQQDREGLKCAVLCYGYMLDLEGFTDVAEAARQWGFVNPCGQKSVADLPRDVPLLIVRAGGDQTPGLNDTLDRFVAQALARNLPVALANHSEAPHAFDLEDDSAATRRVIQQILAFLRGHLLPK